MVTWNLMPLSSTAPPWVSEMVQHFGNKKYFYDVDIHSMN